MKRNFSALSRIKIPEEECYRIGSLLLRGSFFAARKSTSRLSESSTCSRQGLGNGYACTTRNQRKAARLARTYDELEVRIARLLEQEELGKVRPELDGNQIAEVLGISPGPVLGRAYKPLLAVRLDEGPIGPEAARERLLQWWEEQPEAR